MKGVNPLDTVIVAIDSNQPMIDLFERLLKQTSYTYQLYNSAGKDPEVIAEYVARVLLEGDKNMLVIIGRAWTDEGRRAWEEEAMDRVDCVHFAHRLIGIIPAVDRGRISICVNTVYEIPLLAMPHDIFNVCWEPSIHYFIRSIS